jgi:hypothetical protein
MKTDTTALAHAVRRLREGLALPRPGAQGRATAGRLDAAAALAAVAAVPELLAEAEHLSAELRRKLG